MLLTRRRVMMGGGELYREVEYIENVGCTQYIDTLSHLNNNSIIESEALLHRSTTLTQPALYGVRYYDGSTSRRNVAVESLSSTNYRFIASFNTLAYTQNSEYFNKFIVIKQSKDGCFVNGIKVFSYPTSTFTTDGSLYLLAQHECNITSATPKNPTYPTSASTQLKFLRIMDSTNLVKDFIPVVLTSDIPDSKCANPSLAHTKGTAGLWDKVEDKFYGNSGTGTFTYKEKE